MKLNLLHMQELSVFQVKHVFITQKYFNYFFILGNEPSDSVRVVNALLTEIDKIKTYSNILIFATSNMTGTIDLAFIDRADIKQYLGIPNSLAIYHIYSSCINELIKVSIFITVNDLIT